ncbi:MAG: GTP 3',8-cyclase MoaA [Betaproteobacteria bacterium]
MATTIPLTDVRAADPDAHRARLDAFARAAADAAPAGTDAPVADTRGRPLHDLRISVTDRCNFRCVYCMPKDVFDRDYHFLAHSELLTFEEIARVAKVFVDHGVNKIRLTGGEPLLRRNVERLVEMLARLGDVDLTLTTNGALLAKKAAGLRDAGLKRVTVSLDSLDDATFRAMNDVDFPVAKVLEGIDAAAAVGLTPVKINMVVKRGMNEASILPMARHFKGSGHIVRFIEFMDVGATNGWRMDDVLPSADVVRTIDAAMPLVQANPNYAGEVAERWRYRDGGGEIGVIASVTQAFCRDCTRARLSTDGRLYTCLFATDGCDLRGLLRDGHSDDAIGNAIAAVWRARTDRYSEIRTANTPRVAKVEMSYIGG